LDLCGLRRYLDSRKDDPLCDRFTRQRGDGLRKRAILPTQGHRASPFVDHRAH